MYIFGIATYNLYSSVGKMNQRTFDLCDLSFAQVVKKYVHAIRLMLLLLRDTFSS